jgi:hypothetical protein
MIAELLLALAGVATPAPASGARTPYAMTIYAEDVLPNGHVFFSLSDGTETVTQGFYPERRGAGAPIGRNGGVVRDDSHTRWTARKRYALDKNGYQRARRAIAEFAAAKRSWCLLNHCGDYTEGVARAAGVALDLPWTLTGRNRPGIMTSYLERHGGETNPAYRPPADAWFFTLRASAAHLTDARDRRARLTARRDEDTAQLTALKAAYDREYTPQYEAYRAYCAVTLEPAEAAARQAECDRKFGALEAIRTRYERRQKPYRDDRAAADAELTALDASTARDRASVDGAYAQLTAAHLVSDACPRSDQIAAAECALEQRGRMH